MKLYQGDVKIKIKSHIRHIVLFSEGPSRFNPADVIDVEKKEKLTVVREHAQELFEYEDFDVITSFFLQNYAADVQFYEVPLPIRYYLDKDVGRE